MEKLGGPGGWGEPGPPPGRQAGQLVAGSCQGQRPRAPVATCQLSGHMALMQAEGRQTGRAACEDCLLGGTVAAHEGGLGARHGGWLVRGCGHGVGAAAGRVCAERAPGSGLSPWPVPTGLSPPSPVVFPQLLLPCPGCGWWPPGCLATRLAAQERPELEGCVVVPTAVLGSPLGFLKCSLYRLPPSLPGAPSVS